MIPCALGDSLTDGFGLSRKQRAGAGRRECEAVGYEFEIVTQGTAATHGGRVAPFLPPPPTALCAPQEDRHPGRRAWIKIDFAALRLDQIRSNLQAISDLARARQTG